MPYNYFLYSCNQHHYFIKNLNYMFAKTVIATRSICTSPKKRTCAYLGRNSIALKGTPPTHKGFLAFGAHMFWSCSPLSRYDFLSVISSDLFSKYFFLSFFKAAQRVYSTPIVSTAIDRYAGILESHLSSK